MGLGFAAAMLAVPACGGGETGPTTSPATGPSVVLITLDTTRVDRIGCYGYSDAATPAIDGLALEGVRFDQARTPVPLTLPAHASLLTATYPPYHGIRDNGVAWLSDRALTVSERLRDAGYRTGAFVAAVVLDARFGLDQGFDTYDAVRQSSLVASGFLEERRADAVVDAAIEWLGTVPGPYFLWVHLFDPHAPYDPPPPYKSRFEGRLYDGEIAFADQQIGRLLDVVRARPDGPSTYVALTADHGEGLGDHGETSHGVFVYDTCVRVPLILSGPGLTAGQAVAEAVSLVDLPVTILDACDVEPLPESQGMSLLPLIAGDGAPRPPVYFESYNGFLNHGWSPLVGVTNGRDKVIIGPTPSLYDVVEDPVELRDRAADDDRTASIAAAARSRWRGLQNPSPAGEPRQVSEEERRALESLGYTTAAPPTGSLPYPSGDLPDPAERIAAEEARQRGLGLIRRYQESGFRDRAAIDAAVGVFKRALKEDPGSAVLHEYAGTAYVMRAEFPPAIHHLRLALARRPHRTDARYNLAVALLESGDREGACRQLDELLKFEPTFVKAARLLAITHEQDGRLPEAIDALRHFIEHRDVEDDEQREARRQLARMKDRLDG